MKLTKFMIVFIRSITTVIDLVTEAPPGDALEVITAELCVYGTINGLTHLRGFIRVITAIVIPITTPLTSNTNLEGQTKVNNCIKVANKCIYI